MGLLESLAALHTRGRPGVLGIVFATQGSTYQKPGALVLLDQEGMRHGVISGGCLEPEVEDRARRVNERGRAEVMDFDTRSDDDLVFGSGTGCRGRVHLLLLPQAPGAALAEALGQLATSAGVLELALQVEGPGTGSGSATLVGQSAAQNDGQSGGPRDGQTWHWTGEGTATAAPVPAAAAPVLLRVRPPPRVMLLGAGPETPPLYLFMQRLGWSASVVEHRGRWQRFAREAGVPDLIAADPDQAAPLWRVRQARAAVIMTHNYALDLRHLAACAASDLSYIGLLGPAARRDQLLAELDGEVSGALRDRLHAPVGLPLGGRGPESLALAIAAQLQQHFSAPPKA